MTRARLLAEASPDEIAEWRAFEAIEGLTQDRADLRMGILAANAAAIAGVKDVRPGDFLPDFDREPEEAERAEMERQKALGMKMAAMFGGTIRGV